MARTFSSTAMFLSRGTGTIPANVTTYSTGTPVTMACWMNSASIPAGGSSPMSITATSVANVFDIQLPSTGKIQAETGATTYTTANDTLAMSTSTWYHVCAVWASATDRRIFRNGVKNTDATSKIPTGIIRAWIACGPNTVNAYPGQVAFPAAWNVALDDNQVLSLSQGCNPKHIRPDALVMYCPLTGGITPQEPDLVYSVGWQVSGGTTETANPRIYM